MSIEYPCISICTPTYNRNNFIDLMMSNLLRFDYDKKKLEWVIDDDGDDKMIKTEKDMEVLKKVVYPIKIKYLYNTKRRSIGEKRNNMVKNATYKIVAMMDTDDMYLSSWLRYGIEVMKKGKHSCVCSNQMLFLFPDLDWLVTGIRCEHKRQGHESGMIFTKKHHRATGGFMKNSQGEGTGMIDHMNDGSVGLLDIYKCLICICHNDNTINKDRFIESGKIDALITDQDKKLLKKCLNI
jgi:glycosyltransferase involved in cell wall biosynthesis